MAWRIRGKKKKKKILYRTITSKKTNSHFIVSPKKAQNPFSTHSVFMTLHYTYNTKFRTEANINLNLSALGNFEVRDRHSH